MRRRSRAKGRARAVGRGIGRAIGRAFRGRGGRGGGRGGGGKGGGIGIMITVAMAVVAIFFVIGIIPELELRTTIDPLLNWTPITVTMLGLIKWILPVGAIIAVIILIFRKVRGR